MKRIFLALLVVGLLVGAYAWKEYNRGHEAMSSVKAEASASATDICAAFSTDETAANTQYLGKTISVKGIVASTTDEEGSTTINLVGSDTGSVACKLDPLAQHARKTFQAGEEITVKGICTGYLMDVVMERCVVESK